MERHLIILNPKSGRGQGERMGREIGGVWAKHGWQAEVVFTSGPGDATRIIQERGGDYHTVISGGGDGTLHEVVQGLDLEHHRIAVLPIGTGNDFAWLNHWDPDPSACAKRIAKNGETRLDLGLFEGIRFHNSVGFGFEAEVNHRSQEIQHIKGAVKYVAALLQALPHARTWQTSIDGGSGWHGRMFSGGFFVGSRVGGVFMLCPQASNQDGLLDLVIAERLNPIAFVKTVTQLFRGSSLTAQGINTDADSGFAAVFEEPIPVYIDGEARGTRSAIAAECLAGALRTY